MQRFRIETARACDKCLLLFAGLRGTPRGVSELCLGGLPSRLYRRFGVVRRVALSHRAGSVRTLFQYLGVRNSGDDVMPNYRLYHLPSGSPQYFLIATSADRGLFVSWPSDRSRCGLVLRLLLRPRYCFLRDRLTRLRGVLDSGRVIRYYLGLFQAVCLSNFRANGRLLYHRIGVRRFVHFLGGAIKCPFFRFSAYGLLCFFIRALGILGVGYQGRVSSLIRRDRCVLPALFIRATLRVHIYRLIRGSGFQVGASGYV